MFIELIDVLRCVRPHEESWLVAATTRMEGRDIVEGMLGCPVCGAEYPVVGGVVLFDSATMVQERQNLVDESEDEALRLAAFLDLTGSGGLALLAGSWAVHAPRLADLVQVQLLLLNPPAGAQLGGGISAIRVNEALPLAAASCRGIALDLAHASPLWSEAAARALRPRGRLLAPISLPPPPQVSELARDEQWWVGERAPIGSPPVKLQIARG